jgi:dihydrofolate reductase
VAGIRCRECHQGYIKLFHSALPPPSPPVAARPERYLDEKILGFSNRWYKPFSVLTSLRRFPTRSMSEMAILQQLSYRRYPCVMRPLRYSINVTLDGCCDHRAIPADEDLHRHAIENLDQADALLFGRVTYEMMEAAFRPSARAGARPDWMEPFARTIDAAKKYVVSSTLDRVDWNAELVRGDLGKAIQQLKRKSGKGLLVGGVKLPLALVELGLIDEYEFVVQPRLAGHGPTLFAGLSKRVDLRLVSRLEFSSGAVAMRYEPRR